MGNSRERDVYGRCAGCIGDDRRSASRNCGFNETIAIATLAAHGNKEKSRTNLTRVIGDALDVSIAMRRESLDVAHDVLELH